jgi:hypothetical protein
MKEKQAYFVPHMPGLRLWKASLPGFTPLIVQEIFAFLFLDCVRVLCFVFPTISRNVLSLSSGWLPAQLTHFLHPINITATSTNYVTLKTDALRFSKTTEKQSTSHVLETEYMKRIRTL